MVDKGIKLQTVLEILRFDDKDLKINVSDLNFDEINNINDLFGSILEKGMQEIKQFGFKKSYVNRYRELSKIKGKIDFNKSISKAAVARGRLVCNVEELSINNIYNQILKFAIMSLFKGRISDREDNGALSRSIRIRLLQYVDILKNINNINGVDTKLVEYIKQSAPFYYANGLHTALYISELYGTLDIDGRSRLKTSKDWNRCRNIFERHILNLIRDSINEYEKELGKFKVLPRVYMDSKGRKLPDIIMSDGKRAITIDVYWYDKKHHSTGKLEDGYDNSHYANYISDTLQIANVNNLIVYAEKREVSEYSEYTSDLKQNYRLKAYVFDMYLNKPVEVFNKRFKTVLKDMTQVR